MSNVILNGIVDKSQSTRNPTSSGIQAINTIDNGIKSVICGLDPTTDTSIPIKVNSSGELEMTAELNSAEMKCMGSEDGTPSGTQKQIHVDGSGNLQTNVVNTVNISPANNTNSHITDDPANSVAVGLKGRTTIGTATTETFLLCDAAGHLQVDNVSSALPTGAATETTLAAAEVHLGNIDGKVATETTLAAAEVHLGNIDTATSSIQSNVSTSSNQTSMITELQDIEADIVAMSAKLPSALGQQSNAASISTCRSNTAGAYDMSARTIISGVGSSASSTKLLCDTDGHLQVDIVSGGGGGVSNGSEVSYVSGQALGIGGTHTGGAIAVSANTRAIFVEHNFTDADISFNVEQSIDGSTFFPTTLIFNVSPSGTTTGINVLTNTYSTTPSAVGFAPHIRFTFTNGSGGAQTINSFSYVIQS